MYFSVRPDIRYEFESSVEKAKIMAEKVYYGPFSYSSSATPSDALLIHALSL